tara:strand:- start:3685 stop:4314 length:630 start_codon:yes stop_codon:yes gene_type:complete
MSSILISQNELLLNKLMEYYNKNKNLTKMLSIINGESKISLRIIDWFATNYSKKNYIVYNILKDNNKEERFKVYDDYKLKLKAYSKKRFDPFCRWERITIPYGDNKCIQTTLGQLNFFKWALENKIIQYIEENYENIETDMNSRNNINKKMKNSSINSQSSESSESSTSSNESNIATNNNKTRKKRQELSLNASKSIKKEDLEITVSFQ